MLALVLLSVVVAAPAPAASAAEPTGSRVLLWGSNGFGRFGDEPISNTPVEVPDMTDIVEVDAGGNHSVALRSDGRVLTWGANDNGQLGDGTTTRRKSPGLVPGLTKVVEIEAEGGFTMALRQDGSVWQWGMRRTNTFATSLPDLLVPTRVPEVSATSLGAGVAHRLAITGGRVAAWGYNGSGQLGDGTTTSRWTPGPMAGLDGAVEAAGGGGHSIVRRGDGTVWAVGLNGDGQLGDGTRTSRAGGAAVPALDGATAIASGDRHALALVPDGTVLSWGDGSAGQNGNGMVEYDADRLTPAPVAGVSDVVRIEAGQDTSMALNGQGVWTWGWNTGVKDKYVWSEPLLLEGTAGATDMAAGGSHGLVLLDGVPLDLAPPGSRLLAWGSNAHGSLGDGTDTFRYTPVEIPGLDRTVEVAAGMFHSLALRADGRVLAWGHNARGQVGDGTTEDRWTPTLIPGLTHVVDVEAEGDMSLAVRSDGTVWQWGRLDTPGLMTSDSPPARLVPTLVPGVTATQVGAGDRHLLASAGGTVRGWGWNDAGELGSDPDGYHADPVLVPGFDGVDRVGGGLDHTLGLRADGTIRAVGGSMDGQLGDGTTTSRFAAITVPGITDAVDIAVGYRHSMALRANGTVLSWGHGGLGQLGYDAVSDEPPNRLSPGPVPGLTGVTDIAAGNFNSLAINDLGVWAWGWSTGVQDRYVWGAPVLVDGTQDATSIAGGHDHGLALIDGVPLDDPTPPAGTVVVNSGDAYAASGSVSLDVTATDAAGVTHVALSNDATSWTERPYAPTQAWTLTPSDGDRTVWAKWRDGNGNWSAPASDSVTVDTTPPTGTFTVNGGKTPTNQPVVSVTVEGKDELQQVARVYVSLTPQVDEHGVLANPPYGRYVRDLDASGGGTFPLDLTSGQLGGTASDGVKTVYLQFETASLGQRSSVVSRSIVLDRTKPVVTPPRQALAAGTAITSGKVPVRLVWSGSDGLAGVARYELRQQVGSGSWTTVNANLTGPSATLNLTPGHVYRYAVRAFDKAGNGSAYAYGNSFWLLAHSEASTAIRYAGAWGTAASSGYWGGKVRYGTSSAARATFTFTGRSVGLVTTMSPSRGRVAVYVNGAYVKTIDLYSGTWRNGVVAWGHTWSTSTKRTVELRVLGTAGRPRVDIDGWVVSG